MEQKDTRKKIVTALVALAIAVVFFLAGFLVARFTKKREVSSFEWAMKTVGENYFFGVSSDDFLVGALKGMADECLDYYSEYYTAAEYRQLMASNSGKKSGVGVSFTYVGENVHPQGRSGILIESVVGGSPAYESGLRAGEFVESAACGRVAIYSLFRPRSVHAGKERVHRKLLLYGYRRQAVEFYVLSGQPRNERNGRGNRRPARRRGVLKTRPVLRKRSL